MLIDGNSLTYRAFFALPTDMTTASGQVTNAVFGFTSMLINLYRDHEPDGIAVAFDLPQPTFRHVRLDTYKANRDEAPDILRQQMGLVRQVIDALAIPSVDAAGFEADDIIATLATRARDAGDEVIVVTGDRDSYQLVEDPSIKVLYNRRGVSDYAFYDEAGIAERTGVVPGSYVTYAALRGDNSDNLPGVPGVGEKTAAKLVNKYGDLDGIFAAVAEQTPKLRENLAANEERVRLNEELMLLVRDVELDMEISDLRMGEPDLEEVRKLFDFLEFRTLFDRLQEVIGVEGTVDSAVGEELVVEVVELESVEDALKAIGSLADRSGSLALAAAWVDDTQRELAGLALADDDADGRAVWLPASSLDDPLVGNALAGLLSSGGRALSAHDAKPLIRALARRDVDVAGLALDTKIAAYLLDPAESRYLLDELLVRYANLSLPNPGAAVDGQLDLDGDQVSAAIDAGRRAVAVDRLAGPVLEALDAQGLRQLNDEIEVPLIEVLARMEAVGVGVDVPVLESIRDELTADCERYRDQLYEDAGREFNVNSTKQLREILFEELALTPQKKTKTGYSTDATSLEKLKGQHPIIDHLLAYREVEKLRSTYGLGLLAEVSDDGRIHATFNQTVARTGRLSSDRPNLHNIPVRTETGRSFRRAFVPGLGNELLVADYNQIELRCIAHLALDPGLIMAFEAGDDIHEATAARVFDVEPAEVTIEQRSKAKMVSYGLAYGMEAYGLAQRLGIPTSEAAEILKAYFEAFPAVEQYMDRTVAEARERGYTETLFGRRRMIPELSSGNYRIRQAGERQAMNAGIQGLAADIFKVALVRLDKALRARSGSAFVILQVHDEVVIEVPPSESEEVLALTEEIMSKAFDLRVPLAVNLVTGPNWADAKP